MSEKVDRTFWSLISGVGCRQLAPLSRSLRPAARSVVWRSSWGMIRSSRGPVEAATLAAKMIPHPPTDDSGYHQPVSSRCDTGDHLLLFQI